MKRHLRHGETSQTNLHWDSQMQAKRKRQAADIEYARKLISSQQGCMGNTNSSNAVTQTPICIILCVVRGVTACAGSYLKEQNIHSTLCVCVCVCLSWLRFPSPHWTGGIP